jgi:hypothetical protein
MLSSEQDKIFYVNAIRWGVTNFVVKPIRDDTLRQKLLQCTSSATERHADVIAFNLPKYLRGEYRKAVKGNFSLSLMFATVVLTDDEDKNNPVSQAYYANLFCESIQGLLWDTDQYIKFNSKYYLGVFPFCGRVNLAILRQKIDNAFHSLYTKMNIPDYVGLVTAFVSYPDDAHEFQDLQQVLVERVEELVPDSGIKLFI